MDVILSEAKNLMLIFDTGRFFVANAPQNDIHNRWADTMLWRIAFDHLRNLRFCKVTVGPYKSEKGRNKIK